MTDIGSQLRSAREAKGLTLEQVFKATRIKITYLDAIEANQLEALPGPVQARGFVRSYANYLGLDGEHLAALLDAHKAPVPEVRPVSLGSVPTKPQTAPLPQKLPPLTAKPTIPPPRPVSTPVTKPADKPQPAPQSPSLTLKSARRSSSATPSDGIPNWVLIVGAVVLFVVGALLVLSALTSAGQQPAPPAPVNLPDSIGRAGLPDQVALSPSDREPVSITLTALEHVWARITVDGQTAFEGMLEPQSNTNWQAANEVIVETGNAAALKAMYRGQQEVLGERGQIVARAWGRSGVTDVPLAVTNAGLPQATVVATNTVP